MVDLLLSLVWFGTVGLKVWALVDSARRPTAAFALHNKQTKPIWLAILGASLLFGILSGPLGILGIAGTIAAIVYLVDVRPAVSGQSSL